MSDRQDGRPIRNLHALVCQRRVPPPSSSTSPVLCVDVPASGVSEAETGSEPKVRPANACWPAFSLRDWRLLSPGVLGEGSLGRLGRVVGLAWGAMPPSPVRVIQVLPAFRGSGWGPSALPGPRSPQPRCASPARRHLACSP